jgi:hypothetical protein
MTIIEIMVTVILVLWSFAQWDADTVEPVGSVEQARRRQLEEVMAQKRDPYGAWVHAWLGGKKLHGHQGAKRG